MRKDMLKYLLHNIPFELLKDVKDIADNELKERGLKAMPPQSPSCDTGTDEYGLWRSIDFNGVPAMFRWIEAGSFMMGSPSNEPGRYDDERQYQVTLTHGYWLADTACTQALWKAVMGKNPAYFKEGLNNPVEQVSWYDAQDFLTNLNLLLSDLTASLPTEAQWEYACRSGTTTPFSFGDTITLEQVNYDSSKTVPVKSLPANAWGLYEMHGNVLEWCNDWHGDYQCENTIDPIPYKDNKSRVLRGGAFNRDRRYVRCAFRSSRHPNFRFNNVGFRVVLSPLPQTSESSDR